MVSRPPSFGWKVQRRLPCSDGRPPQPACHGRCGFEFCSGSKAEELTESTTSLLHPWELTIQQMLRLGGSGPTGDLCAAAMVDVPTGLQHSIVVRDTTKFISPLDKSIRIPPSNRMATHRL